MRKSKEIGGFLVGFLVWTFIWWLADIPLDLERADTVFYFIVMGSIVSFTFVALAVWMNNEQ